MGIVTSGKQAKTMSSCVSSRWCRSRILSSTDSLHSWGNRAMRSDRVREIGIFMVINGHPRKTFRPKILLRFLGLRSFSPLERPRSRNLWLRKLSPPNSITSVKFVQLLNACWPTSKTLEGIFTLRKALQLQNASALTTCREPSLNCTSARLLQPPNAPQPNVVTLEGIVTSCSALQFLNA